MKHLNLKSSNKKRLTENDCSKILCKGHETTNENYLDAFELLSNKKVSRLTVYSKLIFKGVYYCSYMIKTKT